MNEKLFYDEYIKIFLEQNSVLNLISKNDEKYIWEKHIYDSLSIEKFFEKYKKTDLKISLLDIGTGGGFPAVPIALTFPDIEITALDSINKKINAVENIKTKLGLKNLKTICCRAEKITGEYDVITSRAVAPLKKLLGYAMPSLKNEGYFVVYKSVRTDDEISDAQSELKKYCAKIIDIIEYSLPLDENYIRKLVVVKKNAS